jgi:hypothetical protein
VIMHDTLVASSITKICLHCARAIGDQPLYSADEWRAGHADKHRLAQHEGASGQSQWKEEGMEEVEERREGRGTR